MKRILGLAILVFGFVVGPNSWADYCRDFNANRILVATNGCSGNTCLATGLHSCDGVEVRTRPEQPGIWIMSNYTWCTLPNPPFEGVWGDLLECSAGKGLSVIKSNSSLNGQNMQKQNAWCEPPIRVEEQSVQQELPIVGANFSLIYSSSLAKGKVQNFSGTIKLSSATLETEVSQFDISVERDSLSTLSYSFLNDLPNRKLSITWDGKDASGNEVQGYKKHKVTVNEQLSTYVHPVISEVGLGGFRSHFLGLGGWAPSVLKYYDISAKKLVAMSGEIADVEAKAFATGQIYVASKDSSLVYVFDSSNGQHLFTKTGLTGTTIFTFIYDSGGRLSEIQESFGRSTTFNRNLMGKLISVTAPKGQTSVVSLDSNGYMSALENPNGEIYTLAFSGTSGLLSSFAKPGGQARTYVYDVNGNLTSDTHSGGSFIELIRNTLSAYKHEVTLSSAMGRTSIIKTNASDTSLTRFFTNELGQVENYQYTKNGNNASEDLSQNGVTSNIAFVPDPRFPGMALYSNSSYFYVSNIFRIQTASLNVTLSNPSDPFSVATMSFVSRVDGANTKITTNYNPSTKTFSTTSYLGKTKSVGIDSYERMVSFKEGNNEEVEYTYTNENLTNVDQGTRSTTLSYNVSSGFLETVTNALGQATSFVRDSAGRVISRVLPDSRVIGFSYDVNGNLLGVTPPGKPVHNFALNAHELVGSYSPPALSGVSLVSTSYVYNLDKQLTQINRPDGASIDLSYNATSGWLSSYTTPTGTFSRTLDSVSGLPSGITKPSGAMTTFLYIGQKPSTVKNYSSTLSEFETYNLDYTSRGLLNADRIYTESAGPSTVLYVHNDDEDLVKAGALDISYGIPSGQITTTSLGASPNQITDEYTYNAYGEATAYQAKYGSTVIYDSSVTRNSAGRIYNKVQTMNSVTDTFDYSFDLAGRLTQARKNSVVVANYGLDSNSNRVSGNVGAQATTASYDNQDRLNSYNTLSFTYNANGDLLSKTNSSTSSTIQYTYDVFGNLTQVVLSPSTTITYQVDALNRRVAKFVNGVLQKRWAYMDQYRIAAELSPSGSIDKRFVYGSKGNIPDYMISGGENYRIISDHLGSPRLVVKVSDGSVAQRMNHDEFGKVTENTNPGFIPFGFAGGLYDDETMLVRFGARDYDSEIGRWTSKDPISFGGGDLNLYGYVLNNPINFIDPKGLHPGQSMECMDGLCSGTRRDQFMGETSISIEQAMYNDAVMGSTGLAVAALVASPAIGQAGGAALLAASNACMSNISLCVELVTTAIGGFAQGYTGDQLPFSPYDSKKGAAVELIANGVGSACQ